MCVVFCLFVLGFFRFFCLFGVFWREVVGFFVCLFFFFFFVVVFVLGGVFLWGYGGFV